jgi:hypothetical protein
MGMMTAAARARDVSLGRRFMARVGGLPFDSAEELRQPCSRAWAEQVIEAQARLAAEGARLSDALYPLVSQAEDTQFRRTLVNTRRGLFAGRALREGAEVARRIGGSLGDELRRWLDEHARVERLLAEPVVARELAQARARLRALAAAPRLRQGLILASPSLDRYLASYLKAPPERLTKKQRQIERSLTEYVYRSACKTSPFSAFTGVAVGEFGDHGGHWDFTVDEQWSDHTQLNIAVLARLGESLLADDNLRLDLPITLVSGWTSDANRVRYVRRTILPGDDSIAASFDAIRETMFFLRRGDGLGVLLDLYAECGGVLRYRELLDRLAGRVAATRAECDRYLSALLSLGLLSAPALAVDLHHPDPTSAFADSVADIGTDWSRTLAANLREVSAEVRAYRGAALDDRRQILARVRERLALAAAGIGSGTATMPQTLVYEDTRAARSPVRVGRAWFEESFRSDLASLSRVFPAFDLTMQHRLVLRGFFLARFGRGGDCPDLLAFVNDFQDDIYDQYVQVSMTRERFDADGELVPADNWLDQEEITAIDDARRRFTARMRERCEQPGDSPEIVLDEQDIGPTADALGPVGPDFAPYSHFLQIGTAHGRPWAVLNRSWGGVSFPFSRFTHGFDDLGLASLLRGENTEIQPAGAVFAEVTGGTARTNLNLHGRMTDYEIVCPGETSFAEPEAQLPLDDLSLRHDDDSGRLFLWSRRLQKQVIPIYLGYLVPMALPDVARTLLLLTPAAMVTMDVWAGVPGRPDADGVLARPRVRYGNLVLSRRTWTVPVSALPPQNADDTPAQRFLAWQRWRLRHGLDRQVFFTLEAGAGISPDGEQDAGRKQRDGRSARPKPQYLDFDSYLSLQLLEHAISDGVAAVKISEMLPGGDDLHVSSAAGRHVAEIVMETFYGAGADRAAGSDA